MRDKEPVEIVVDFVKKETAKAVLCEINGDEIWIPKSVIDEGEDDLTEGEEDVTISIAAWFARKEGLD